MTVRTRFAPSPTGALHIGSVRTALYCWLYAKKQRGQFILRIEDTDRERSTQASVDAILAGMAWLGLTYDEGPFYQTQRLSRYREVMQQWLAEGKAYRCYCSKTRIDVLRAQQLTDKQKPRYDGHCRRHQPADLSAPHVVRFANPEQGDVCVSDLVHGDVAFANAELDDVIIWRSDDTPTYNFSVVIDDYDMQITHVIRGDDHLNNTPRQLNMLHALGATPPQYAHIPMILGNDGKRLSKRHSAVDVLQYRDQGFLPQALLNYLVRLGWSHGDQEIFSQAELIDLFDLSNVNKAAATFDHTKLEWLNQHYLKTDPIESLVEPLQSQCQQLGLDTTYGPALTDVIAAQRTRIKTLREMAEHSRFCFVDDIEYDLAAQQQHLTAATVPILTEVITKLTEVKTWDIPTLKTTIKHVVQNLGMKMPQVAQPMRVALTGNTTSPSIDVTLTLVGRERSLERLMRAKAVCTQAAS